MEVSRIALVAIIGRLTICSAGLVNSRVQSFYHRLTGHPGPKQQNGRLSARSWFMIQNYGVGGGGGLYELELAELAPGHHVLPRSNPTT